MRTAYFSLCIVAVSEASVGGGFALIEQGASGLGNLYVGAAAVSRDAATVWFDLDSHKTRIGVCTNGC